MNLDRPHFYPEETRIARDLDRVGVSFRADNLETGQTCYGAFPFANLIQTMYNRIQALEKRLNDFERNGK